MRSVSSSLVIGDEGEIGDGGKSDDYTEGQTDTLFGGCRGRCANKQPRASKRITLRQASNMMDALEFAREIGTPLNAHATIHWAGTKVGDDPDGRLFAKVREGLDKWLRRQSIPGGLTAIWVRERLSGGSADVVHCHLLF